VFFSYDNAAVHFIAIDNTKKFPSYPSLGCLGNNPFYCGINQGAKVSTSLETVASVFSCDNAAVCANVNEPLRWGATKTAN
jgi:hypothetical protein